MLFAIRLLSVQELFHALAVKGSDTVGFRILKLCGLFIEVWKNITDSIGRKTIHFVRFSAKEFLLNARDECGGWVSISVESLMASEIL